MAILAAVHALLLLFLFYLFRLGLPVTPWTIFQIAYLVSAALFSIVFYFMWGLFSGIRLVTKALERIAEDGPNSR